jgi:oligoribonuclease
MNELIVLLDLETTGLSPANCEILECGILVATTEFEVITSKSWLMSAGADVNWNYLDKNVVAMHNKRQELYNPKRYVSLVEDIAEHNRVKRLLSYEKAESRIIGWLEAIGVEKKMCALTGSTISFDRGFLATRMPDLDDWFDYHSVDISSIQIAIQMFGDTKDLHELGKPSDRKMHRAIPDCEDSLAKYKWEIELLRKGISNASDDR